MSMLSLDASSKIVDIDEMIITPQVCHLIVLLVLDGGSKTCSLDNLTHGRTSSNWVVFAL